MKNKGHCEDLLASLSDYVDGTLDGQLCEALEQHLQSCHNCTVVVNTLRRTVELYQQEGPEALPNAVHQRLLHRLQLDDFLHEG